MTILTAYLTGTSHASFRTGEAAEIIGVKHVIPSCRHSIRLCFHIRFADGVEDYVAMSDDKNYTITTGIELNKAKLG